MAANERKLLRCAVYTRKSSEHGLEQDFNSLDAQREAAGRLSKSKWSHAPDRRSQGRQAGFRQGALLKPGPALFVQRSGNIASAEIDVSPPASSLTN